jgi:hypothetical protein
MTDDESYALARGRIVDTLQRGPGQVCFAPFKRDGWRYDLVAYMPPDFGDQDEVLGMRNPYWPGTVFLIETNNGKVFHLSIEEGHDIGWQYLKQQQGGLSTRDYMVLAHLWSDVQKLYWDYAHAKGLDPKEDT